MELKHITEQNTQRMNLLMIKNHINGIENFWGYAKHKTNYLNLK